MGVDVTTKWKAVNIPIALVERIDLVIKSGKYGYTSRADFVVDAVRRLLRELGYYP